ncbi:MAG TPA: GAF domain-containing protein, partial [Syntrophothermus lipocalidus]|nr:GAF domain-containing protein [Syntrophothermus lipocalidus]
MEPLSEGENLSHTPCTATATTDNTAEDSREVVALLETSLDHVLQILGLEMGSIWLHPYKVTRGLPPEAMEVGKAATGFGLGIPQVQAVPDWQKIEKVHHELAPMAGVIERLGIRASMAISLQQEGRIGGLAVASSQPRVWSSTEIALFETVAYLLETVIKRMEAEEERRRANRALRVLSRCSEAIVRATDVATLMKEICRLVVEEGGYRLAWVGFAEEDATKTVRPVAQAGFEEGYLETVTIS